MRPQGRPAAERGRTRPIGVSRAGRPVRAGCHRPVRDRRPRREGGGSARPRAPCAERDPAMIVLELVAAALGLAAVVYLLIALVKPVRF